MENDKQIPLAWKIQDRVSKLSRGAIFLAEEVADGPEVTKILNDMQCVEPNTEKWQAASRTHRKIFAKSPDKPSCNKCRFIRNLAVGCVIKEESIRKIYEADL